MRNIIRLKNLFINRKIKINKFMISKKNILFSRSLKSHFLSGNFTINIWK